DRVARACAPRAGAALRSALLGVARSGTRQGPVARASADDRVLVARGFPSERALRCSVESLHGGTWTGRDDRRDREAADSFARNQGSSAPIRAHPRHRRTAASETLKSCEVEGSKLRTSLRSVRGRNCARMALKVSAISLRRVSEPSKTDLSAGIRQGRSDRDS